MVQYGAVSVAVETKIPSLEPLECRDWRTDTDTDTERTFAHRETHRD